MVEAGYNTQGRAVSEISDSFQIKLNSLIETGSPEEKPSTMNQALNSALDKIEEAQARGGSITGLSTGFADLDKLTSGLQPADMIVIAGRPSCGKTTIGMNIADHVAQTSGKHVMVFSLEMPEDQLTRRLLASNGMVNMTKINNADLDDDDWGRLSMATSKLMESKMLIDDAGGLTPSELRARAKRAHKENELGLILIDYLGLMRVPQLAGNRNAEISEISQSVKELAKELNVPVIVLSQLNRSLEQRADKRPINSDLRDSGAIEQDADLILFVYRDEVYNDNSPDRGTAELIIGKQRNGPLGKVRLTFQGEYSRFCNFAGPRFNDEY
jgi:replicative DNA helicase